MMKLIDNSIAYAETLCALVLDDPLLVAHMTDNSLAEWRTKRAALQGASSGLVSLAPMDANLSKKRSMIERWPAVVFRGDSSYYEPARIELQFPITGPDLIDPDDGSRWHVAGEPDVRMTINTMYSMPYTEASKRMAVIAAAYGLAGRFIDVAKTMRLVACVESGAEAELREAQELQQQKIEAISAHVHSCRERRGLKAEQAKRVPSFDALALGLQPSDGAYEVSVRVNRWDRRRYVLYVGLPDGALLRRLD